MMIRLSAFLFLFSCFAAHADSFLELTVDPSGTIVSFQATQESTSTRTVPPGCRLKHVPWMDLSVSSLAPLSTSPLQAKHWKLSGDSIVRRSAEEVAADTPPPTPLERRAAKYQSRVDQWTHAIVRYQARLLDARLGANKRQKIQEKLDAAILKVQDESTSIEAEDPD